MWMRPCASRCAWAANPRVVVAVGHSPLCRSPPSSQSPVSGLGHGQGRGHGDKLTRLRETMLDDQEGLRALFLSLFPDGLVFKPVKIRNRRVWSISGDANLGGTKSHSDPTGIHGDLGLKIPFIFG
jgi:hypothetical protein